MLLPYSVRMSSTRVKTALIGVGRWGAHVARELQARDALVAYANQSGARAEALDAVPLYTLDEMVNSTDIEAVWIATPIETHAEIAQAMLEAGKHVMCEKPLATTAATAAGLAQGAQSKGLVLATGYVFLYHPVYEELKRRLAGKQITSLDLEWKKHGTFGETIELNLLTHHLAIAYDLLGMPARGTFEQREAVETNCDRVITRLHYPNAACISRIDRASDEKIHRISIMSGAETFLWDGQRLFEGETLVYESPDQALAREVDAFLSAIRDGAQLTTHGTFGAEVLKIHELLS